MPARPDLLLQTTLVSDLEALFLFQLDEEANHLAAFISRDPADKVAYFDKYTKLISDPTINMQTIRADGRIVGSISKFEIEGEAEITYWIDKSCWGRELQREALRQFLALETNRPLLARVAFDNVGSQAVLEKSGFVRIGKDRGFARARQAEIEEFIYRLD